jgi:hypothetical protein
MGKFLIFTYNVKAVDFIVTREGTMNRVFSIVGLALILLGSLMAADVAGKWAGEVPSRGEMAKATFVFKVDGGKATGTMTGPQGEVALQDVTISGDQISFSSTGGNAKILFKGTVSGDQLKMTRQREGGEPREFTLKRVP